MASDLVLCPILRRGLQYCGSLNKFLGQPDDGLHTGPKHVVVYYILLLIVILLCS